MPQPSSAAVSLPRLNPFPFPSETTLRFALLVIFTLCGSAGMYGTFWDVLHRQEEHEAGVSVSNALAALQHLETIPGRAADYADMAANFANTELLPQIRRCMQLMRPSAIWQIMGILLTVVMTACLYWLIPAWSLRLGRFQPIRASDPPGIQEELERLCGKIGLPKVPILVWSPLAAGMPLVFGRIGRYYLAMSGAFVARLYGDKSTFRAIILHELAHIHSRDIDKAYLTMATCGAFVAAVLVPLLLLLVLADFRWSDAPALVLKSILWLGIIMLAGASVLRAREYCADVQASAWEGTNPNIDRVLGTLSESTSRDWRQFMSLHPALANRRKAIADPSRLFPLGAWDAFAIGVAAWLVIDRLTDISVGFFPSNPRLFVLFLTFNKVVISACIMLCAVGAVGIGVWRGAFAALVKGEDAAKGTGRLGLAMAAGSLVPTALTLIDAVGQTEISFSRAFSNVALDFPIIAIVTASSYFVFRWIADAASAWLEVVLRSRSPRPTLLLTIFAALVLVIGAMSSAFFVVFFFAMGGFGAASEPLIMYGLVIGPPTILASVLVWAFPLAAGFWRGSSTHRNWSSWVFLEPVALERAPAQPWRPGGALWAAITMGLGFCLLAAVVYFRGYFPVSVSERIGAAFSSIQFWIAQHLAIGSEGIIPVSAGLFQVLAAVVATAFARRFHVLSGLFAASVAGGIIVIFDLLFLAIGADPISQREVFLVVVLLLGFGAIPALPASIAVAWAKTCSSNSGIGGVGNANAGETKKWGP